MKPATLLNKKSGMLGLCGKSDLRDVQAAAHEGDTDAINALAAYNFRIIKYIGAYAAVLDGVDAIVFTAGVGENDKVIRRDIINGISYLGVKLDAANNEANRTELTTKDSAVQVFRIETNEELVIAEETYELIKEPAEAGKA